METRSPGPASDPSSKSGRNAWSPTLVDRVLRLERWLSRSGLSRWLYVLVGFPVALLIRAILIWPNRVELRGLDRLPPPGKGYFLLSNHISMGEAPVLASLLFPRAFWFPSKAELFPNWVVGGLFALLSAFHAFPVRRGRRDRAAIELMEDLLARGDNLLLFPEGTRSRDGQLLPGKKGVGMLVHNAQPLVVPVYVRGFERIWKPGALVPFRWGKKVSIQFGHPMDLSHWWEQPLRSATAQGIVDEVMEAIRLLGEELDQAGGAQAEAARGEEQ